jgi:protein transport protein SEC61 subunit gamma-like protein
MSAAKSNSKSEDRTFEDKVLAAQDRIESGFRRIGRSSWARILRMARKPTKQEFTQTSIICGIGMFILGFIGFVVMFAMDRIIPSFFEWLIS